MSRRYYAAALTAFIGGVLANQAAETIASPSVGERLDRHRNLAKAFYENPTTQLLAVEEFKKALELVPGSAREELNYGLALLRAGKTEDGVAQLLKAQKTDPKIPHTWFNLGIVFKKESQYDKAVEQLEQMAKLVPGEAVTHYNLGVLYKLTGRAPEALREFETTARLNANLAGPRFQLFNAYKTAGRAEDAAREEKLFYALKKQKAGAAIPEDLEWSFYSEILDVIEPGKSAADAPLGPVKFTTRKLGAGFTGMAAADLDGDGRADLVAWGPLGVQVVHGPEMVSPEIKNIVYVAPADFDNDGFADLCVLTANGVVLLANRKDKFELIAAPALPKEQYRSAVWVDFDHDYDLDLILLGAHSVLLRNNGKAGFSDETAAFPFVKGLANAGVVFDVIPDTDGFDIAVAYEDRPGVVYRDNMAGHYEAVELPAVKAGAKHLSARDFNSDGATDLAAGAQLIVNTDGKFEAAGAASDVAAAFVDLDNRGLADLVGGGVVMRNLGAGRFAKAGQPLPSALALVAGDFDADGHEDLAAVTESGEAQVWRNDAAGPQTWLRARLTGVKNMKLALGAEVEVKAGSLYQKQTYLGVPLHFGLRSATEVETVRITWANGLIQNELRKPAGRELTAKEAPRLSGSCPMIFTWNGSGFEFVSDVLAVAPLGAAAGDGVYFPVDHDEYVPLPARALAPRDGRYHVRVTEELREVSYLDKIELVAIDHAAGEELYTNEKFKSPPFPEFRLFGVRHRIAPVSARDHRGADVLAKVLRRDATYADTFERNSAGVAERHSLELDFGQAAAPDNRALLVLSGWVDWADGSTFRAVSQEKSEGLEMPIVQVLDRDGRWQTVVQDMGIPAGKPKSIVVDLTGKFLSPSRRVRILTDLCVYWDEIFLSEDVAAPQTTITRLGPDAAKLSYRGFSQVVVHPERKQPERFNYGIPQPASAWNPTPGMYTRFGDVEPLLGRVDDQMVIMGAGDELALEFSADRLPKLAPGRSRDFLLFVDGWAKDGDANTAFARTVEPLPFHAMSRYPYPASEKFPEDEAHLRYRRMYNTRPALHLLSKLRAGRQRME